MTKEPKFESSAGGPEQELLAAIRDLEIMASFKEGQERLQEIQEELIGEVENFFLSNGAKEYQYWGKKLQQLAHKYPDLLTRRENPEVLFNTIAKQGDLRINFSPDVHSGEPYPNVAALGDDLSGLAVPMTRGFGMVESGASVFISGFRPSPDMTVRSLPRGKYPHYSGKVRYATRMAEGKTPFENLKFVLFRLPRKLFPEERMTDEELEQEMPHITRMFSFE